MLAKGSVTNGLNGDRSPSRPFAGIAEGIPVGASDGEVRDGRGPAAGRTASKRIRPPLTPPPAAPMPARASGCPPPVPRGDPLSTLAAAAVRGDQGATRRLVEALAPRVLRIARAIAGSSHPDVEDMTQESLMAILGALPAFRGGSSVGHYANRITARTCIAARRRGQSRRDMPMELESAILSVEALQPQETVAARRRRVVRSLLETLPEAQAETLALRVVLGMSLEEVAAATGVPVNTVRSRVRLGKEALRKRIDGDPGVGELLGRNS